jgi:hypothetical protein
LGTTTSAARCIATSAARNEINRRSGIAPVLRRNPFSGTGAIQKNYCGHEPATESDDEIVLYAECSPHQSEIGFTTG